MPALALGSAGIAAAYVISLLAPRTATGAWLMVFGLSLACSAGLALGAFRSGGTSRVLWWTVVFVAVELAVGFSVALLGRQADPSATPLVLGLPLYTAVVVYGVGVVPMIVLPISYALTFDRPTEPDR